MLPIFGNILQIIMSYVLTFDFINVTWCIIKIIIGNQNFFSEGGGEPKKNFENI